LFLLLGNTFFKTDPIAKPAYSVTPAKAEVTERAEKTGFRLSPE
jgi:hypothetical protein